MLTFTLTGFQHSYPLTDVLTLLEQLPVQWCGLEAKQLAEGWIVIARCEAPVDAPALQESLAELLPDISVHAEQGQARGCSFVATLLAPQLRPLHLASVLHKLTELGLVLLRSRCLSGAGAKGREAWQLQLAGHTDVNLARKALFDLADQLGIDVALQPRAQFGRQAGLICFDMDSTLIKAECIDQLAIAAGIGEQVAAITASAMRGEIDFIESFTQRMALLSGLSETVLLEIAKGLQLMDGAQVLINTLKARGFHTAILSGGFVYFAEHIQSRLGIDEIHANDLEIVAGALTGRVTGTVVDGKRKAELIQRLAAERGLSLDQVIAVGDGANDLPMLGLAGMGVAIHAKPLVRASADFAINTLGLDGLCYLLGLEDQDMVESV